MGLSPSPMELVFIAVLALLILGPNKLPEAAKSVGKGFREMRDSFQGAVDGPDEDDDRFDLEGLANDDEDEEEFEEPELSEAEKKAEARRVAAKGDVEDALADSDEAGDHQNDAESSVPSASSSSTERE